MQVMRRGSTHKNELQQSGESSSSGSTVQLPDAEGPGAADVYGDGVDGEVAPGAGVDADLSHQCSVSLLTFGIWEQHTAIKRRYTTATLDVAKSNTYGRHLQGLYGKQTPEQLVERLRDADTLFDQSDILHILYLEKCVGYCCKYEYIIYCTRTVDEFSRRIGASIGTRASRAPTRCAP